MGVKCVGCGRYISYDAMSSGSSTCDYTPSSEFTTESIEWTCAWCNNKDRIFQEFLAAVPENSGSS